MKRISIGILSLAASFGMSLSLLAADNLLIDVTPAFAPNGPSSPSWGGYVDKAISALESNSSMSGDRQTDPSAYEAVSGPITPLEMFYTDFESWRAQADPNPSFLALDPVFQAERGNRIHFGVNIVAGEAVKFALHDVSWQLDSSDQTNYFDAQGDFSTSSYSATRVGIDYVDGVKGNGNDIVYDSGEGGGLLVNELVYVGVGGGFSALSGDGVNDQDSIVDNIRDLLRKSANTSFDLRGIYTLANPQGGEPIIATAAVDVQIPAGMGGDFNFDRQIDCDDFDLLTQAIAAGENDILYDLDANQVTDFVDLEIMVVDIANTWFGDANCDGEFNTTDLIDVMVAGLYETGDPAVWSTGDFNADGVFDSGDLVTALERVGYEVGPRAAVAAVPEPATIVLTLVGLLMIATRARRR